MRRGPILIGGIATALVAAGAFAALRVAGGDKPHPRVHGAASFEVRTGGGWTIVRNGPGGLAIGNARNGWEFVGRSTGAYGYAVGFVRGDGFAQCAWIDKRNLVKVGRERDSGCDWLKFSRRFIQRINCPDCSMGTRVKLIRATAEYANYSKRFGLRDRLRMVPAGRCLEWRWVSKGGGAVMVKDRRHPNGEGSWVFVRRNALPKNLPVRLTGSCPRGQDRER